MSAMGQFGLLHFLSVVLCEHEECTGRQATKRHVQTFSYARVVFVAMTLWL